jgi:hypothetical protein
MITCYEIKFYIYTIFNFIFQSILDLMSALDHRKYEAIQLTFKQVPLKILKIFSFSQFNVLLNEAKHY